MQPFKLVADGIGRTSGVRVGKGGNHQGEYTHAGRDRSLRLDDGTTRSYELESSRP